MREFRCQNPHPRLVGKQCNAKIRVQADAGTVYVGCWRCNGTIKADFESAGTAMASVV